MRRTREWMRSKFFRFLQFWTKVRGKWRNSHFCYFRVLPIFCRTQTLLFWKYFESYEWWILYMALEIEKVPSRFWSWVTSYCEDLRWTFIGVEMFELDCVFKNSLWRSCGVSVNGSVFFSFCNIMTSNKWTVCKVLHASQNERKCFTQNDDLTRKVFFSELFDIIVW